MSDCMSGWCGIGGEKCPSCKKDDLIIKLQSQVDALMQEYCPADITVEQWQRIEAAAITASSTESAAIQQALQEKGDEKSNSTT